MYAARAGLSVVVLEKLSAGGQMALTSQVDNYPGFPEGIDGFELADKMQQGAEKYGAVTELAEVRAVDLQAQPKKLDTSEGEFFARTVIVATGANPRLLGVPMEKELTGKGVHYCAHCDGHFYKGKTVAVVGGGNSAVADALQLSRLAEKVYLIHRRDSLRATKIYHKSLEKAENIEILWNNTVEKLLHADRLTGIIIKDTKTGQGDALLLDGLFVSVGREPASWLAEGVGKDEGGYIIADESTKTNIPGVFAIGDVRTKAMRQIVTAVADGAVAAQMAEEYIAGL
jgi:thioredoxin reductase (NADPH)